MASSARAREAALSRQTLSDLFRVAEYQEAATTLANLFQAYGDLLPEGFSRDFAVAFEALLAVPLLPGEVIELCLRRRLGGALEIVPLPPA